MGFSRPRFASAALGPMIGRWPLAATCGRPRASALRSHPPDTRARLPPASRPLPRRGADAGRELVGTCLRWYLDFLFRDGIDAITTANMFYTNGVGPFALGLANGLTPALSTPCLNAPETTGTAATLLLPHSPAALAFATPLPAGLRPAQVWRGAGGGAARLRRRAGVPRGGGAVCQQALLGHARVQVSTGRPGAERAGGALAWAVCARARARRRVGTHVRIARDRHLKPLLN